ncbi:Mediator of RNA polymerase II transcription subunit 9 [Mycena venus]|uniref:Mediator of RNA polymerase II transcription subunit 9 n=1 Tax=Mycena venus TaxID=2733690 RepID=A0A8H6WYE0_9AGAR|nr:Mediator of RNA polymerase II transcription subunit 9 [Mycena venus]
MTTNPLPAALFESLLLKLVAVLELTQRPEGTVTPQAKQAVLHATNEFKSALNQAKELATNLPGGELLIEDQTEVIEMLTELRDRKRQQLAEFATRTLVASSTFSADYRMEIDSMASTPFHES